MKLGQIFTRDGIRYEYLGVNRGMLRVRVVGTKEVLRLRAPNAVVSKPGSRPIPEDARRQREEARAARQRKRDEERYRLRMEARAAREKQHEVAQAASEKQLEEAQAARKRKHEVAQAAKEKQREEAHAKEQIRVREYERIKEEADELIRTTPALRQLAIEYWSTRSDDDPSLS
jgi:hypothetical protein